MGDELKKQVLSPHEIRKMLEKKIEERNKVLIQKKEYQLKINTDRTGTNGNLGGVGERVGNKTLKEMDREKSEKVEFTMNFEQ